jgi:hypothetical protein
MRRFFAGSTLLVMGLVASFSVAAEEVAGLYEAEVPVASQEASDRVVASRAALEEVLIKVSGSSDILQRPELKPMLDQAEQWVQRYQYRTATAAPGSTSAPATPSQTLWAAFDRQTINRHLSEAGLPVWGLNRPRTLLWLAIEDGSDRFLLGGDNRPDMQEKVTNQAQQRGLPLSVPLLDLQDQGSLKVADVWGDFPDVIFKASERYQADAVLVGRVYAVAADQWQSHWTLYHRGTVTTWDSAQGSQDEAIAAGVAGAAEQFAKRYALSLTPEVANSLTLTIENVASVKDYARALHYLQSLDPVAAVQIARVDGAQVSYRLKVRGEPQGVIRSIGWGKTLMPVEQGGTASTGAPVTDDNGAEQPANGEYRYRIVP